MTQGYLEWLLRVEHAPWQLENVVGDGALLGERVLDAHRRPLRDALDQDVAHVVHLQLEALKVQIYRVSSSEVDL